MIFPDQTLVVDWNLDSASHWVNQYPVDKCQVNQLRYPMDRDLHGGQRYPPFDQLLPGLYGDSVKVVALRCPFSVL